MDICIKMVAYFCIYILLFTFSLQFLNDRKNTTIFFFFLSSLLIFFASFRFEVGPDYLHYELIYNQIDEIFFNKNSKIEYGYRFLNYIINKCNLGFHTVLFISTFIVFINLYFACKYLKINPLVFILSYFSLLYLTNVINLVRHGIAVSFIFLAFSIRIKKDGIKKSIFPSIFILFIGSLFHYVSLLMIPFIIILKLNISRFAMLVLICVSFVFSESLLLLNKILSTLHVNTTITETIVYYSMVQNTSKFGLGTLLKFLIFLYYLFINRTSLLSEDVHKLSINLSFYLLLVTFLFANIPTLAERLSNVFTLGYVLIFYDLYIKAVKQKSYLRLLTVLLLMGIFLVQTIKTPVSEGCCPYYPYRVMEI